MRKGYDRSKYSHTDLFSTPPTIPLGSERIESRVKDSNTNKSSVGEVNQTREGNERLSQGKSRSTLNDKTSFDFRQSGSQREGGSRVRNNGNT